MTSIVGFGNSLRGEDAFGVDVVSKLEKYKLQNTKLISTFQLTPELCLQLKDSSKIIFIDAAYKINLDYKLICSLDTKNQSLLSHHISIKTLLTMLKKIYNCNPSYEVISMATKNFEEIKNKYKYDSTINKVVDFLNS